MKIALIRPPRVFKLNGKVMKPSPPLGLAFIAAAIEREGHQVTVIDGIADAPNIVLPFRNNLHINGLTIDQIIGRIPKDVRMIGFSCMFTGNWPFDRILINRVSEAFPDALLIAGGEHISALSDLVMKECSGLAACAIGEGEETIVEVCKIIETRGNLSQVESLCIRDNSGRVIKTKRRSRTKDIESLAWPAWHLFPTESYFKNGFSFGVGIYNSIPIMATRGCPYSCTFCSSPDMWGRRYMVRSVNDVVDEIEHLVNDFQVNNVDFYDLTAIIKDKWIIEFSKELLRRNIHITWQIPAGTRSEAITKTVAEYLKLGGCKNLSYAPESGSPEILELIKKKVSLSKMLQSVAFSNAAGLSVKMNIIIGMPDEKHKHIWETIWFLVKASWFGAYDTSPAPFQPYPGTELYNRLQRNGKINLETDQYYEDIINSDNFFDIKYYNYNISRFCLMFYFYACLVAFYGTNYLFRPWRLVRLVKNVMTFAPESRGEALLSDILKRTLRKTKPANDLISQLGNQSPVLNKNI